MSKLTLRIVYDYTKRPGYRTTTHDETIASYVRPPAGLLVIIHTLFLTPTSNSHQTSGEEFRRPRLTAPNLSINAMITVRRVWRLR